MAHCHHILTINSLLLVVLTALPLQAAVSQSEATLAGRAVSMELVTDEGLQPVAWPAGPPKLKTQTVTIRRGDNIYALLRARGIRPDAESYTLVYELNPKLEGLDPLLEGGRLVLPIVSGGDRLREKIKSGHIVLLTLDKQLKNQLSMAVNALVNLSARLSTLASDRFADPVRRKDTVEAVQDAVGWLSRIHEIMQRRESKPIRKTTLRQIVDEADVLRLILAGAVKPGGTLSAADQKQISAIHSDLDETAKRWDEVMGRQLPPAEPQYEVVVELRGRDPDVIKGLRVYYVVRGLFRKPIVNPPVRFSNFNGLGSGSSATLPIHKYVIWAAKDGDPTNPVTPEVEVKVVAPPRGASIPP